MSTVKQIAAVSDESFSPVVGPGLSFEQQKEALRTKLETEKELSLKKIKQETELPKSLNLMSEIRRRFF